MSSSNTNPVACVPNVVIAEDGARITYYSLGEGPSVVVIPGALAIANEFFAFAEVMARDGFCVQILERRGHGQSAPQAEGYAVDQDCADVGAVLAATNAAYVIGHSYGGLVALEAARHNKAIKKVVLYEPGVSINNSIPTSWLEQYNKLVAAGKRSAALVTFIKAVSPESASTPNWMLKLILPLAMGKGYKKSLALLETNSREHSEVARLNNTYQNYADIKAETLCLYGGKGHAAEKTTANTLAATIQHATVKELPGLNHFAFEKAPQNVASVITDFLAK